MTRLLSFLGVFRNPPEVAATTRRHAVATAPDESPQGLGLAHIAHLVTESDERCRAAISADDDVQLRRELYALRHLLEEVLA
jgi:hypothetical protein